MNSVTLSANFRVPLNCRHIGYLLFPETWIFCATDHDLRTSSATRLLVRNVRPVTRPEPSKLYSYLLTCCVGLSRRSERPRMRWLDPTLTRCMRTSCKRTI
jgi:hypothetical protein